MWRDVFAKSEVWWPKLHSKEATAIPVPMCGYKHRLQAATNFTLSSYQRAYKREAKERVGILFLFVGILTEFLHT